MVIWTPMVLLVVGPPAQTDPVDFLGGPKTVVMSRAEPRERRRLRLEQWISDPETCLDLPPWADTFFAREATHGGQITLLP